MGGITGIWNQADDATVGRMVQTVAHRGPNGLIRITKNNSSLGASRLIIRGDPSAPGMFSDSDTGVTVLFNGEIYNVADLHAAMVAAGSVFRTDVESEVVAKLYTRHGSGFARYLKGMFAIAILDGDRLILTRDRFGIKPLYYARVGRKILFGSEIKAILAHPEATATLSLESLQELAVFGYIFSLSKTPFENIRQVEPGTTVTFSEDGESMVRYWQAPKACYLDKEYHMNRFRAVAQLRQRIIEAVDSLLSHGNHRIGIYLSGGVDSTILALVSHTILGHPITTFTLADSTNSPDLLAAREVARKLGIHHIERQVTVKDCLDKIKHFVQHYESLVAGGVFDIYGGLAFHLLSELVSEHVKVAFSGEGADELFGGYYWIYTHPLGFADRIKSRLPTSPNGLAVRELVNSIFPHPEDRKKYRRNIFDTLVRGGLANYHLQSVDRSAGAFGLEVRPVYLFDDLAEFALNLPIEYKVPNERTTKWILREAFRPEFERLGLEWILSRPKEAMPSALRNLAPLVNERMEDLIDDQTFSIHPLRTYFPSKTELYLFEMFADIFLSEGRHALQNCDT